jgi:Xaa-Pro aminopeptidase
LAFRQQQDLFQDLSFATISASGPHGAIVHYHATPESNFPLVRNNLYLVDSGGQYLDGTTDITRTVAIGTPTQEHKDRFTRVLKGHIALATAKFPPGTSGQQLDAIARLPLWQIGLDYDHGTGHGVGSYLAVHEGPQRISKKGSATPLEVGMIISNEPGYYKAGEYGIRIESLVTVVADSATPMLTFETLTMVPIDRHLIVKEMLAPVELQWLNEYHRQVRTILSPLVDGETKAWLMKATEQL